MKTANQHPQTVHVVQFFEECYDPEHYGQKDVPFYIGGVFLNRESADAYAKDNQPCHIETFRVQP